MSRRLNIERSQPASSVEKNVSSPPRYSSIIRFLYFRHERGSSYVHGAHGEVAAYAEISVSDLELAVQVRDTWLVAFNYYRTHWRECSIERDTSDVQGYKAKHAQIEIQGSEIRAQIHLVHPVATCSSLYRLERRRYPEKKNEY